MATTVGQRLAALRAEHELTLASLSEMTGISKSTLSRLETDQRKPTLELLLPLSRTYQVTLDDLVSGMPTRPWSSCRGFIVTRGSPTSGAPTRSSSDTW